jgi:hypothetical protein
MHPHKLVVRRNAFSEFKKEKEKNYKKKEDPKLT